MRLIPPAEVTRANLVASNVPDVPPAAYAGGTTYADGDRASVVQGDGFTYKIYESLVGGNIGNPVTDGNFWLYLADTYAEWNVGTTYAVDHIVISTASDHAYQSLQAGNIGHSLTDQSWWLDLGPTNRFKMFDRASSSQTLNGESIDVTFDVTGRVNAVSVLNMTAATVQLIMSTAEDGEIYNETVSLVSSGGVTNWWEYFFLPVSRYGDWTFTDLPVNRNPTIRVIVTEPNGIAKVGTVAAGLSRDIGRLVYPSSIGIQDYSRKEADEFGAFTIVERGYANRGSYKTSVDERQVDAITNFLKPLRATPIVIVGVENYRSTWIFGFMKDWSWQFAGPNESYLMLELEGLV
ncbi:hypothetical protein M527_06995 [Sphingobium indicum IP26]|uniref:Uncharacterized protein n=1 Tax=Sphingobium indicum F2 TaxID=1450518 RepID=A0A8E0WT11_9SPHN|nr:MULTISPECIES: hypothetical protein [Sphingobium]EPR09867.1 hypothetical protein M527_06995 [Sphingobium indicum IP26]EQB04995.1 hypothetical protein L286_09510 [Sphingobium sp. HDIP04]KER36660.1 hypothetical protein AL00_09300 [Sphingobium indicum F2]